VAKGEALLSPSVTRRLITDLATRPERRPPGDRELSGMTEREREVLDLVARGSDNRTIARRLFLSEKTVRNHVSAILDKLELGGRLELLLYANRQGLARIPTRAI
jgi:DNA-binding NarL/FixJ family response regulator